MAIQTGMSAKDRAAVAQGLSRLLADTYLLYHTEAWNAIDPIAERIRARGAAARGTRGRPADARSAHAAHG